MLERSYSDNGRISLSVLLHIQYLSILLHRGSALPIKDKLGVETSIASVLPRGKETPHLGHFHSVQSRSRFVCFVSRYFARRQSYFESSPVYPERFRVQNFGRGKIIHYRGYTRMGSSIFAVTIKRQFFTKYFLDLPTLKALC